MDLLCWDDIDEFGQIVEDPVQEAAQEYHHRLIEEYGSNIMEPDRGVGITNRLSGTDSPDTIEKAIEHDFRKDTRTREVKATVTDDPSDPNGYLVDIRIELTEATLNLSYAFDAAGKLVRKAVLS